jgi:hypothetical protein
MLSYKGIPDISALLLALVASYYHALIPGFEGCLVDFPLSISSLSVWLLNKPQSDDLNMFGGDIGIGKQCL